MNKIIQLKNIQKTYDRTHYVLDGVTLEVASGELVVIYGDSGSGKSTLLNIIGLLDNFDSGEYWFNTKRITQKGTEDLSNLRAESIGFIFQSYGLIESLSVLDNIMLPFLYSDARITQELLDKIDQTMRQFRIEKIKNKKAALLSGGEKQRVAIVRAVVKEPILLIADEPTGNLDEKNAMLISSCFKSLSDAGVAVLIVTHNTHLIYHPDQSYKLVQGRLVECIP